MRILPALRLPRLATVLPPESRGAHVVEEAENELHHCQYRSLRHITCRYEHGVLHLVGTVPSYYVKQVAQELVSRLDDVDEVVNDLEVAED
jgi:hypothetical protein